MELLTDGIVAVLSAIGLTAIVWCVVSLLTERCEETAAVLFVSGAAEHLEQTVRSLRRWNRTVQIVILDDGMDKTAQSVARLLCAKDENIHLCTRENLLGELKRIDGRADHNRRNGADGRFSK